MHLHDLYVEIGRKGPGIITINMIKKLEKRLNMLDKN